LPVFWCMSKNKSGVGEQVLSKRCEVVEDASIKIKRAN